MSLLRAASFRTNRSGYNHYGSQYDVLTEIAHNYLPDIARALENVELQNREDVHGRVTLVLQYMEGNLLLSRLLLHSDLGGDFVPRLFSLPKIQYLLDEALCGVVRERERRSDFSIPDAFEVAIGGITSRFFSPI